MRVKVFTLRFDPRIEGFDDGALRDFGRDKEILSVRDNFFLKDEVPYWTLLVSYNLAPAEGDPAAAAPGAGAATAGRPNYREVLGEADWPIFNALRDWRSETAKEEGVPPYVVLTNEVLAQVIRRRPKTLNDLGLVPGVGVAKLKRYGRQLLARLGAALPPGPLPLPEPPAPAPADVAREESGGADGSS